MDRFDRIYRLHGLLTNRRTPIPLSKIMNKLECSKATVTRSIEELRNYLNAPWTMTDSGAASFTIKFCKTSGPAFSAGK